MKRAILLMIVMALVCPVHADLLGDIIEGISDVVFGQPISEQQLNETPPSEISVKFVENVSMTENNIVIYLNHDNTSEMIVSDNPNELITGNSENVVVVRQR